jgi:hypothetical protein
MRKFLIVFYYSFIPATIFSDFFYEPILLQKVGGVEAVSNIILVFYFIKSRKTKFINTDWLLIEALLFTVAAGILLLLYSNVVTLMFINTVGFYLTHFMYIIIFRKEGSVLPAISTAIKEWKMILVTLLFMIGILIVLVPYVPSSLLILSFVYSVQMLILCWMAYFRITEKRPYIEGFLGVVLIIFSNLWLTIDLLCFKLPYTIAIYVLIYTVSQHLMVSSVLRTNNAKTKISLSIDNQ